MFAAVLSNTAEEKLMRQLIAQNEHNLLTIPAAHHVGQTLDVHIRLALRKIIKMVRLHSIISFLASDGSIYPCRRFSATLPIFLLSYRMVSYNMGLSKISIYVKLIVRISGLKYRFENPKIEDRGKRSSEVVEQNQPLIERSLQIVLLSGPTEAPVSKQRLFL